MFVVHVFVRTGVRRTCVRFDLYPQGVDNHRGWYSQGVDNYCKWSFSDHVRRFSGLLSERVGRAWGGHTINFEA